LAEHWGYWKPWRCPRWSVHAAAAGCEAWAVVFRCRSPLTR